MGCILGLDLAKSTGYAVCSTAGVIQISGVWRVGEARDHSRGHNGHMFNALYNELVRTCGTFLPTTICWERAHHRGGAATRIALGLVATCQLYAARNAIRIADVHTATLKKYATGDHKAGKDAMKERASASAGYVVECDDEADAIIVAQWAWEQEQQEKEGK